MQLKDKLILALDMPDPSKAIETVDMLGEWVNVFKIGFELFLAGGPDIVKKIGDKGKKIFLDLKFHDIPNTVLRSAELASRMGVYMFNVHTSGGSEMMKRCQERVVEVCLKENLDRPKVIGVTVLTSISQDQFKGELGFSHTIKTHAKQLASLAKQCNLDGVVASGHEASMIKRHCGDDFIVVTPGIRPSWSPPDDQQRTMTPKDALKNGADYIVVGRGILGHDDPLNAVELISLEVMSV
ncbi:MAG: orotidine-5'-phosphate decarboxylase [Nitrospirota bacterium]|nr:MAG: orotidine-5'-phosphate decarboxylase [Nitrospirota bacterium]